MPLSIEELVAVSYPMILEEMHREAFRLFERQFNWGRDEFTQKLEGLRKQDGETKEA